MKPLGNVQQGILFVVSAPAGTGKTTLIQMLCEEFDCVVQSISSTTRPKRPKEVEGKDYHFVTPDVFEEMIERDEFLEYAQVFDHHYGTSRNFVNGHLKKGKHVFLVIDTQGAEQLKMKVDAVSIFIRPPSLDELKKRLQGRKTDTDQAIEQRLSWAEKEISLATQYDYQIVNENLKIAYDVLRAIVIAEEHRNRLNST